MSPTLKTVILKTGLLMYALVGVVWSMFVSAQRANAGLDPIDGVFFARGALRMLVWPSDIAINSGVSVAANLMVFLAVVAIAVAVRRRT